MKKYLTVVLAVAMLALGSMMAFAAEPVQAVCPGHPAMFDQLAKDNVLTSEKAQQLAEYMKNNCPRLNGEFKPGMGMMNGDRNMMHKQMLDKAVADGVISSDEATKINDYMIKNCPKNGGGHHGHHGMMNGGNNANCPMNQTAK